MCLVGKPSDASARQTHVPASTRPARSAVICAKQHVSKFVTGELNRLRSLRESTKTVGPARGALSPSQTNMVGIP